MKKICKVVLVLFSFVFLAFSEAMADDTCFKVGRDAPYGQRGNSGYPEEDITDLYKQPCYKSGTGEIAGIQPAYDMECDNKCHGNGKLEMSSMKRTYVVIQPVLRSLNHTTDIDDESYGHEEFDGKEFYSHGATSGLLSVSKQGIDGWRKYPFSPMKTEELDPKNKFAEREYKVNLTVWGTLGKESLIFPVGELKKCQQELSNQ